MKMVTRIFDLRISKRNKKHTSEIKKQVNEIILLDRFEIKKESEKNAKTNSATEKPTENLTQNADVKKIIETPAQIDLAIDHTAPKEISIIKKCSKTSSLFILGYAFIKASSIIS